MSDARTSNPEMVLNTSAEAASYRTDIKGWVSRHGRYYGQDERTARYDGCTHVICDCGQPVERGRLRCHPCQRKYDEARWLALPLIEWDGETPLVLHRDDRYFFSPDDVYDFADEHDLKVSELRLVVCEPNYVRQVDEDYWIDELPEDGELPVWLEKAMDALNEVIAAHENEPLSWSAGKQRVVLPDER